MLTRSRAVAALVVGFAAMSLSACGSSGSADDGSGPTLQYVPTTSYSLKAPATTTTTTTLAPGATTPAGGTSPGEQSYTVKGGDSLSKIAGLFDVTQDTICSYNDWDSCGANHLLLPNDVILIPPGAKVPGSASTATATETETAGSGDSTSTETETETASGEGCTYTIKAGDNPGTVASKYGITYDQLQAANPNRDFSSWFVATATINIPPEGNC